MYPLWQEALGAVALTAVLMIPIMGAARSERRREARRRHPAGPR